MTEIYIFCVCFVQPGFGARLHQSRIYLPVGRISRACELNPKTWTVSVNRLFDTQSGILPG
ncbi:hypothetical protein FCX19_22515 [Escherichia coli]|nr:hypothetical protein [Escherichia coli]